MINTFGIPIIPENDDKRIEALHHYKIIEADVHESFDNIAHIMAAFFDVPIALVSLVDKEEVIFKGNVGMHDVTKNSRGISLCALAVLNDDVIVFENAPKEPCLISNPLVAGSFGLKFYAGAPLTTKEGYHIGTVCIVDKKPRSFSPSQMEQLKRFSKMVMNEIELRLDASKAALNYSSTIEKQRNNLLVREMQLSLAQEMARMASWEWTLTDNNIEWSPEMYKFWGFEYGEIAVTLDKVAEMTHPDDMGILQEAINSIMEGNDVEVQYRRYDKLGKEIFIHTKTLIRKDAHGKPLSVFGIDMDISDIRAIQDDLIDKNHKLSQFNHELASFNYIASHDLREPLRKIQTFTNRIAEYEKERLSEKGQFYFSRIVAASKGMEQLIDSLLLFSKLSNGSALKFVPTDLNEILDEVEEIFSESIAEKKATIIRPTLPTIKALPVQVQQVFSNLISNALKYSKKDTTPQIQISMDKVKGKSIGKPSEYYLKIEVQDNGIGFDPIYEEKIFEVFQRLYSKNQYEGTGIGLAICKKIMQLHNGLISAKGYPDEGALFVLYFPL